MEFSYYPGCTAHSTAWEFNESTLAVFEALGHRLTEIEDWNCCGGASARVVDRFMSIGLPARNLLIANKAGKTLVAPCAGCFSNVRNALAVFREGGEEAKKLEEALGQKYEGGVDVWSLVDFFNDPANVESLREKIKRPLTGLKVVAYYGCQLVRPPEIAGSTEWENPMSLERACEAAGATAIDWSYKVDCCGADLGISHGKHCSELVSKLGVAAKKAGADAIVVACGLCQANLDMRQAETKIPVLYVTELLGEALQCPGREKWWAKHLTDPSGLFKALGR